MTFVLCSYGSELFPVVLPYLYPLAHICQHGSIYSTLAVATERFLSVCRPDRCLLQGDLIIIHIELQGHLIIINIEK